ncbi:hypothetical protein [Pseudomonas fluorescens group sp. PF-69]
MRKAITVMALIALAGCASTAIPVNKAEPVPADELYAFQSKPAGESGKVTVVRDGGMVGSGCDVVVYIDGHKAAKIGTSQRATFYLESGAPSIGVGFAGSGLCVGVAIRTISATVKPNQESFFRISGDMSGIYIGPYVDYQ